MDIPTQHRPAEFTAKALLLGERLPLRELSSVPRLGSGPLVVPAGSGLVVLFRYGAAVLFDVTPQAESEFLRFLGGYRVDRYPNPETESIVVRIGGEREGLEGDTLSLQDRQLERLQVVADVLSKSVALARYESQIASSFDGIEPIAARLATGGTFRRGTRELQRHLGRALLAEQQMVGRVEVTDKPDLVWDRPELDRLYVRLEDDFELRDRHAAIERKLQLISRTAESVLGLVQHRHSARLEWYIILLIAFEIGLTIYDMFLKL